LSTHYKIHSAKKLLKVRLKFRAEHGAYFITIEPNGEGTTKQVGCDGEIARSLDPDRTYNVKFSLLQQSNSSKYLQKMSEFDRETGKGVFPLIITDLSGTTIFYSDSAWIAQYAARVYGKAQQNREWQMQCAEGTYAE
jgi:hypothetical protein